MGTNVNISNELNISDLYPRWSGGAMVLGKLLVPGRPTNCIRVEQGPTALVVGAGGDGFDIFLSSIISLFYLPLSGRRPDKVGWLVLGLLAL